MKGERSFGPQDPQPQRLVDLAGQLPRLRPGAGKVVGPYGTGDGAAGVLRQHGSNANEYKFTGYFKAGSFKLVSTLGQWAPMYGKGDAGTIVFRGADADPDPATFSIPTDGYYTFTMNTEALTYTLNAYDASSAADYTTVGIIGSSTPQGWDNSTALTQSTFNTHLWSLDLLALNEIGRASCRERVSSPV